METEYTPEQYDEFWAFCRKHGITFGSIIEMLGAVEQYFEGEKE